MEIAEGVLNNKYEDVVVSLQATHRQAYSFNFRADVQITMEYQI